MKNLLFVLLVALLFVSCTKTPEKIIPQAPIDSLVANWCNNWNNHDPEGIFNMFELGSVLMDDDIIITDTQQMISEWINPNIMHVANLKAEQLQAWSENGRAGYAGKYSVDYTADDGTQTHPHGVFMVNWKLNSNGDWKITTACINPFGE
jgi:ketosteroid isomerase-like protein